MDGNIYNELILCRLNLSFKCLSEAIKAVLELKERKESECKVLGNSTYRTRRPVVLLPLIALRMLGFAAIASLGLSFANPVAAKAEGLGFSTLSPPKSKFKIPNLGDISIWKNDMEKAKIAYRHRQFDKARKHLRRALAKGNFVAAWYLGHIHRLGLGVPVDRAKAFKYYRQVAIEYDDNAVRSRIFMITLDSLVRVANGYRTGIKSAGIKRDYARALRLYKKAANRGHPAAQFGIGRMYLNGQGAKKNPSLGLRWVNLSARKNYPPALALLGDFYWKGKYVKKRKALGLMMYIIASKNTNEALHPAIFDRLDQLYNKSSDKITGQGERLAQDWMQRYPPKRARFNESKRQTPTSAFVKSVAGSN